jgi:hypothetical protein
MLRAVHGLEEKFFFGVVTNYPKHIVFVFVVMTAGFEQLGFGDLGCMDLGVATNALEFFDIAI